MTDFNVLVCCEESQRVATAFRDIGCRAFSCDLQFCSGGHPEFHIQADVTRVIKYDSCFSVFNTCDGTRRYVDKWDLLICHPPCTYLSNAGNRSLYTRSGDIVLDRYYKGLAAAKFFRYFLDFPHCDKICVENPLPNGLFGLPPYTQIINPYDFGDPYAKRTCLWLKGLPPLFPSELAYYESNDRPGSWLHKRVKGVPRSVIRSRTFPGIARAMAQQWGP